MNLPTLAAAAASTFLLLAPLAAQTCGVASISTVANGGTSFGVGGGNYFDANVTNPAGIVVCAINTKTTAPASAAITVEIYMTPNTYVGNTTNAAVWALVATGTGTGTGSGAAFPPVPITLSNPFYLPFGSHGLFVRITGGGGPQYVSGANTFSNADVTLTLGASQSTAFSSALATPRTWNGTLHYTPGGGAAAGALGFIGAGCAGTLPVSTIRATSQPILGQSLTVDVNNLPQNLAALVLGLSRVGPPPLDLAILGAPGCSGHVSPDVLLTLNGAGNLASFTLPIPNDPALAGFLLYLQSLALDPPTNAFGFVASHAYAAVVGS
jgi:hypothetical protein